jgi:hypothetical protein
MMFPPDPAHISALFNKFAGKEIDMIENNRTVRIGGTDHTYTEVRLANENDPVIRDMHDTAQQAGLRLRLWQPGTAGTMDYRLDRVNAHIEKGPDGKYRIGKHFGIG